MHRIEQIFVPVDFSTFSRCALALARQIGSGAEDTSFEGRLQLAHAVESMPSYIRSVLFPYAAQGDDDREFEAEIADAARAEIDDYFDIDDSLSQRFIADPIIDFGSTRECIRRCRGQFDFDLVVAGAFGEHGVDAMALGSTSHYLIASSTRPVVLVRDYEPQPTIHSILAAVDLGRDCRPVVEVAMGLAMELEAKLELAHVIASPFLDDTQWMVERQLDADPESLETSLRPRLEAMFDDVVESLDIPFRWRQRCHEALQKRSIRFGDPAEEIADAAADHDLVVIGRGGGNNRRGLGRVASAVTTRVANHLVVVPQHRPTPQL